MAEEKNPNNMSLRVKPGKGNNNTMMRRNNSGTLLNSIGEVGNPKNQYAGRTINPELLHGSVYHNQSFASRRQRPTAASFASKRSTSTPNRSFMVSNQEGLINGGNASSVSQNIIGIPPTGHTILLPKNGDTSGIVGSSNYNVQLRRGSDGRRASGGGLFLGNLPNSNRQTINTFRTGSDFNSRRVPGMSRMSSLKGDGSYIVDQALEEQMIQNRIDQAFLSPRASTANNNNQPTESLAIEHMAPTDDVFNEAEIDVSFHFSDMNLYQVWKKLCAMVFITIEVEQSSEVAKVLSLIIKIGIILAVVSFIVSTVPAFRTYPTTCPFPICDNDYVFCPGYQICQDIEGPNASMIEYVTIYFFTAEYVGRLLTCWSVSPRVAGVLPPEWEREFEFDAHAMQPNYSAPYQMFKFFFRSKNLIDLASILPGYLPYFLPANGNSQRTNFVRALRLLRMVRVLRLLRLLAFLKNVDVAVDLIWATIHQSSLLLTVFCFFMIVVVILFGCFIYLAEQGTFQVTNDYPNGAYLRQSADKTSLQLSPFDSVLTGIYWAIGVGTGSADLVATSDGGRALANVLCLFGVFGLAFPVGVIGSELDRAYTKHFLRLVALSEEREMRLMEAAEHDAHLEEHEHEHDHDHEDEDEDEDEQGSKKKNDNHSNHGSHSNHSNHGSHSNLDDNTDDKEVPAAKSGVTKRHSSNIVAQHMTSLFKKLESSWAGPSSKRPSGKGSEGANSRQGHSRNPSSVASVVSVGNINEHDGIMSDGDGRKKSSSSPDNKGKNHNPRLPPNLFDVVLLATEDSPRSGASASDVNAIKGRGHGKVPPRNGNDESVNSDECGSEPRMTVLPFSSFLSINSVSDNEEEETTTTQRHFSAIFTMGRKQRAQHFARLVVEAGNRFKRGEFPVYLASDYPSRLHILNPVEEDEDGETNNSHPTFKRGSPHFNASVSPTNAGAGGGATPGTTKKRDRARDRRPTLSYEESLSGRDDADRDGRAESLMEMAVQELEIIELASNTGMSGTTGNNGEPLVAGGGVHVVAGAGGGGGGGTTSTALPSSSNIVRSASSSSSSSSSSSVVAASSQAVDQVRQLVVDAEANLQAMQRNFKLEFEQANERLKALKKLELSLSK